MTLPSFDGYICVCYSQCYLLTAQKSAVETHQKKRMCIASAEASSGERKGQ